MTSRAMPQATRSYAERFRGAFAEDAYRELGRTGLIVSGLGFGCYRVDDERQGHVEALRLALGSGVNLIDTSTNYMDGGSERAVGRALREAIEAGSLAREQVVVVTKAGYVQGSNLSRAHEREARGEAFPEMVRYADGCWHCIHPEFLEDQLALSAQRTGLATLDVLLLHNPEYFLTDAEHRGAGTIAERREEFYRRIHRAFAFLEEAASAGRIGWYGVSSNTFVVPEDEPEATSLSRMLDIAAQVAHEAGRPRSSHRFGVAQMPFNLLETGAATVRHGVRRLTALEVAQEARVAVLVNRPLNAFGPHGMTRLADFPERAPGTTVDDAAREVEELEAAFGETIAPALELPPGSPELFSWGADLQEGSRRFRDAIHWRQAETEFIRPRLEHAIHHVGLHLVGKVRNDWTAWLARYRPAVERLLGAVADSTRAGAQAAADEVRRALPPGLPPELREKPLSQVALALTARTPGVTSVLVGMREKRWVEDALEAMRLP